MSDQKDSQIYKKELTNMFFSIPGNVVFYKKIY